MEERIFSNHRQILNSGGNGRYVLHIYINGLLVKRIRGTKRECKKKLAEYGVPVLHQESKGISYYQNNIYKLLELDLYAKDYVIDGVDTHCVVEFELIHTTLFGQKEKRHYYVSPIIGLLSVSYTEDDCTVIYHEQTPLLLEDSFSKYCMIPQIIEGKFGYTNIKKTDITLGKFPIRCTTDVFVKHNEKYYNPKFTKDFELISQSSQADTQFYWKFTYDEHFIFHKYVNR